MFGAWWLIIRARCRLSGAVTGSDMFRHIHTHTHPCLRTMRWHTAQQVCPTALKCATITLSVPAWRRWSLTERGGETRAAGSSCALLTAVEAAGHPAGRGNPREEKQRDGREDIALRQSWQVCVCVNRADRVSVNLRRGKDSEPWL